MLEEEVEEIVMTMRGYRRRRNKKIISPLIPNLCTRWR
jgi:hypothetical protein